MDIPIDSLEVATQGEDAYVRVGGRGSFKGGPALKQFGTTALDRGCRRIIVDMARCTGMDSTFMGVLAGLALTARKKNGALVLRAVTEKNGALLRTLGLIQLVTMEAADETAAPAGDVLALAADKRTLTETMLNAHETLVAVAPGNLPKFKDVLTYLKEDLSTQTGTER
jgi:anti-sigma B factor antagonist